MCMHKIKNPSDLSKTAGCLARSHEDNGLFFLDINNSSKEINNTKLTYMH